MDERIIKFIKKHHVLTLATTLKDDIWCSNLFYVYSKEDNALVVTSNKETKHIEQILQNPNVALSIVLETKIVGKIQGVQITAVMKATQNGEHRKAYLKRFPYALPFINSLWMLEIITSKFTDNTLGFGTKLTYQK